MSQPKLAIIDPIKKLKYVPVLSAIERRAYAVAHRLLQLSASGEPQWACPGKQRSALIDRVAAVVMEEFRK